MEERSSPERRAHPWCIYLLECDDGTTYIGVTSDIVRRLRQHNEGKGARYTRGRRPVALLGTLPCATYGEALRGERRLKRLAPAERRRVFGA